jgi:hypothetical protein
MAGYDMSSLQFLCLVAGACWPIFAVADWMLNAHLESHPAKYG